MGSSLPAAIALILVGLFFLAKNLGLININLGDLDILIQNWWPLVFVALGLGMLFRRGR